jgi:hypothetical protein
MIKPGGTDGGAIKFLFGLALSVVGVYLLIDSVRFTTGHSGLISGMMHGRRGGGGGMGETTSMGVLFVPLFIGVAALFFDARKTWAWVVTWIGVAILIVDILSRIRPYMNTKGSHLIIMLVMIAGGLGLMLKAYTENRSSKAGGSSDSGKKQVGG